MSPSNRQTISNWARRWFPSFESKATVEPASELLALEERVLYSAAPVPVEAMEPIEIDADNDLLFGSIEHQFDQLNELTQSDTMARLLSGYDSYSTDEAETSFSLDDLGLVSADELDSNQSIELIVIDASIDNYDQLLEDLTTSGREMEVLILDPQSDGLDRVTESLSQRRHWSAIHLLTHGQDGLLRIGKDQLDAGSLNEFEDELKSWRGSLDSNADLIVYGCEVAQTEMGQSFVNQLGQLTGMDVAASDDLTGHATLGGDWNFEYTLGTIEHDLAFTDTLVQSWNSVLPLTGLAGVETVVPTGTGELNDHDVGAGYFGDAWVVQSTDGLAGSNAHDVYLTHYDTSGVPTVTNLRINDIRAGDQDEVEIAVNDYGEFAVVWTSDGSGSDTVRATFFNSDGSVAVSDFQVNEIGTTGSDASVAISDAGEIVIAWQGSGTGDADGIYAKTFDRHGNALGTAFQVNSETDGPQTGASVAMNAEGDWIVGWHDFTSVNSQNKVSFSVYENDGTLVLDNEVARTDLGIYYTEVAVDIDDSRNFAVVATSTPFESTTSDPFLTDFVGQSVRLNLYEYSGSWDATPELQHRTSPAFIIGNPDQFAGDVELINGNAFLVWEGEASDASDTQGVFYSLHAIDGTEITPETHIGGVLANDQSHVSIASFQDDGEYAIVWNEYVGVSPQLNLLVSNTSTNTLPTAADLDITLDENSGTVVSLDRFGYSDAETNLATVRIDAVSANGTLLLRGEKVTVGQEIDYEDIRDNLLFFVPNQNFNGSTSIEFTVNDGFADATSSNTLSFNVTPVADEAPAQLGDLLVANTSGILVNESHLLGDQTEHDVAALSGGGYVVLFNDSSTGEIIQAVYDNNRQQVRYSDITSSVAGTHRDASVVGLNDGGYIVTWTNSNGPNSQIVYSVFDANGNEVSFAGVTGARMAAERTGINQLLSDVAALDDGGFVITWTAGSVSGGDGLDIVARTFDANGAGSEVFLVNSSVSGTQRDSVVESLGGNRFAIAWIDQNVNNHDAKARVFDAGDLSSGSEFLLTTNQSGRQGEVQLTRLDNGNFVATWDSSGGLDGAGRGAFGAIFDNTGARVSSAEFVLNEYTSGHQTDVQTVAVNGGGFTAFFQSTSASAIGDHSGNAIVTRTFDLDGTAVTGDQLLSIQHHGDQSEPVVARLSNGDVILTFQGQDGDQLGVDNDDVTNDYGLGIYQTILSHGIAAVEGTTTPISINAIGFDTGHTYSMLEVQNIPTGVYLSDGTNTSGANTSFDIRTWNLDNLQLIVPDGNNEDFELVLVAEQNDSGSINQTVSTIFVDVQNSDNPVNKPDFGVTTDADTTTTIELSTLLNGLVDLDIEDPAQPAISTFGISTLPPTDAGSTLVWDDAQGTNSITLDKSSVTYLEDESETIPALSRQLYFDGTGGGVLSGDTSVNQNAAIELWIKPDSLSGERLIFELGDDTQGISLYQVDGNIEVRIIAPLDSGLTTHEPYVVSSTGLSTTEFTQVVFSYGDNLGGDVDKKDLQLFVNGELVDQLTDIPTFADNAGLWDGNDIGLSESIGNAVGGNPPSLFAGSIGLIRGYGLPIEASDVETQYLNTLNLALPAAPDGSAVTSTTLPSGAMLSADANGAIVYDPNGQFESLAAGETTTDTFAYRVANGTGDFDLVTVTVTIQGVNNDPVIATIPDFNTNEDTPLVGSLASFVSDVDTTDSRTFALTSVSAGGSFLLANDGSFTYTPANNFVGTETISFQVDDGNGGIVSSSFDIQMSPVNDLPTSSDTTLVVDERTTETLTLSDFPFSDVESSQLTSIRIDSVPGVNQLMLDGVAVTNGDTVSFSEIQSGKLTYTDMEADESLVYSVSDGTDFSGSTYTLTLQTNNLPEPPVGQSFAVNINEDEPRAITLGDFPFSDPDGDQLNHIEIRSLPVDGELLLDGGTVTVGTLVTRQQLIDGDLVFTPDSNENGNAYSTFDFRVSDGGLDSPDYSATINVAPVNDLPTSADDTIGVNERTTRAFDVSDFSFSDVESTEFSRILIVTSSSVGELRLNGSIVSDGTFVTRNQILSGELTYLDMEANDSIQFRIEDGSSLSASTYTLTMNSIDLPDAPTSTDFVRVINEDTDYSFELADFQYNDLDGDSLDRVIIKSISGSGTLLLNGSEVEVGDRIRRGQINGGRLTFSPEADEFGANYAVIEFSVSDGTLESIDTYEITFHVSSVNDLPTSSDETRSVAERTTVQLEKNDFEFNDVESSDLTHLEVVTPPSVGELRLNGTLVNSGDIITLTQIENGQLTYTDLEADDVLEFRVFDGTDYAATTNQLTLQTIDNPDPPTAANFFRTIDEDTSYVVRAADLSFDDLDGDTLSFMTVDRLPGNGTLLHFGIEVKVGDKITKSDLDNGALVFTPGRNEFGSPYSSFKFSVNDDGLDSASYLAGFAVNPINDAPLSADSNVNVVERTSRVLTANDFKFADVDDANFAEVRIETTPTANQLMLDGVAVTDGTVISYQDIVDGKLIYNDIEANDQLTYSISDGDLYSATDYTLTFTSIDLPETPDAISDTVTVSEGGRVVIDATANDVSNATGGVSITWVEQPEHGRVRVNSDGDIVYRHDGSDGHTSDQFRYRIINADGLEDIASVFINVTPVDDPTQAVNDSFTTITDVPLEISKSNLIQNDIDPDSDLTSMDIVIHRQPENGTLRIVGNQLIYEPNEGFNGNDSYEYQLQGTGGLSNAAVVQITVAPGIASTPTDPTEPTTETEGEGEGEGSTTGDDTDDGTSAGGTGTGATTEPNTTEGETETPSIVGIAGTGEEARAQSLDKIVVLESGFGNSDGTFFSLELSNRSYSYSGRSDALTLADIYSSNEVIESSSMLSEFQSQVQVNLFFQDLDQATNTFLSEKLNIGLPEVAVSAASLVTAGYLTWMIRGGVMLTTLVTQPAAYQYFDVGSLLESASGGETLESIVDQ
ncbi:MAG: tandem-95 repeat protein [Planctomycetota bacterium]